MLVIYQSKQKYLIVRKIEWYQWNFVKKNGVNEIWLVTLHIHIINNLSEFRMWDTLVLKCEKSSCYLIRSVYWMCVDNFKNKYSQLRRQGWIFFWKLRVSSKVKNLVWRVCRDCFPARVRGIVCPIECVSAVKKTGMLCTQCWHVSELCMHLLLEKLNSELFS